MKIVISSMMCAAVLFTAANSYAGGFKEMVDNTQKDFDIVKDNFRAAYSEGYASWAEYEKATGFSLDVVEKRIVARRSRLAMMERSANTAISQSTRGLAKMVIHDLDDINLSILALIRDDRGYAGYIRTPQDNSLIQTVSNWQEGIRTALKEVARSVSMVTTVARQVGAGAQVIPTFVH